MDRWCWPGELHEATSTPLSHKTLVRLVCVRIRVWPDAVHLQLWEKAVVAVLHREELLAGLTAIQSGVADGTVVHLSVSAVERQCAALMQVTGFVNRLAAEMKEVRVGRAEWGRCWDEVGQSVGIGLWEVRAVGI